MTRLVPPALIACLSIGASPASAQQPPQASRLWAVVITADEYKAPIARRPGATRDGRRLANWVANTSGWGHDHVLLLNDEGDEKPGRVQESRDGPLRSTGENIRWAIEQWLPHRVKPGDVVLLAFSGRGFRSPDAEVLLPIDAPPADPASGAWSPDAAVESLLRDRKCAAVLSLFHAPMIGRDGRPVGTESSPDVGERLRGRVGRWPDSTVWLATGEGDGFGAALEAALGREPRPLLATLADLDRDPRMKALGFRQLGGLPPGLDLHRAGMRAPGAASPRLLLQSGHAAKVTALMVRADGQALITASDDSTVRIWRTSDDGPGLLRVLPDFQNGVTACATSPDGRFLAAGDGMGEVRAWDLSAADSRPLRLSGAQPHDAGIAGLAFLPSGDGKVRLATLSQDGRCVFWDVSPGGLARASGRPPLDGVGRLAAASRGDGPAALALAGTEGGELRLLRSDGGAACDPVPGIESLATALALSPSGRLVAVGHRDGRIRLIDSANGKSVQDVRLEGPITALRFGPDEGLAAGDLSGLHRIVEGKPEAVEGIFGEVTAIEFSPDGRWLAACTRVGDLAAWRLVEGRRPARVDLGGGKPTRRASSLAFSPPSAPPRLIVGESDGGVRRWDLAPLKPLARLEPSRGRARRLAVAPDGVSLLQITADERAQLWDLRRGREVRALPDLWASGAFVSADRLAMVRGKDGGGELVLVDRATGRPVPDVRFERPAPAEGVPVAAPDFDMVVASRDGRRIAATRKPGRDEVVYVWDVAGGRPIRVAPHDRTVGAVDFSPDGRTLMTACEDGKVRLWNLSDPERVDGPPSSEVAVPQVEALTAAKLAPDGTGRVLAAGTAGGANRGIVVVIDDARRPGAGARVLGRIDGKVLAVAFSSDGRLAAAAGQGRRLRAWRLTGASGFADVRVSADPGRDDADAPAAPHHTESIHALVGWPGAEGPAFVTGSDDATVRLWKAGPATGISLLGTLASAPASAGATEADWIAFTPEGVYDGSQDGEGLASFVTDRGVSPAGQFVQRRYRPLLTDGLRLGVAPQAASFTPPPRLLIEAPKAADDGTRRARLRITLGDSSLKPEGLRLYQNDVPVRAFGDFRAGPGRGEYEVEVRLAPGANRFYAMAARADDVDARSPEAVVQAPPARETGRIHVLALGVSKYDRNALLYANKDAESLAAFLEEKGLAGANAPVRPIVLTDLRVTEKRVETAFLELRDAVKGHPEDTVVVFLAGHTDLLPNRAGEPRFSLLLPNFPFPSTDPALVALRGPGVGSAVAKPPDDSYLAYSEIYKGLLRLDALQRLVIVDACQAEAVLNDAGVRRIEQLRSLDLETRKARTAYLLASRVGEAAGESPVLKHGLLTFALLQGLGAKMPDGLPDDVKSIFSGTDVDRDGDSTITTRELRWYIDRVLPPLADRLVAITRGGADGAPAPSVARPPDVPRDVDLRASGVEFPLVRVPAK